MIQANELRIGNLLNYQTAENDVVTLTTDFHAIQWATEDPKGFNLVHTPIPLTEEWLIKFGFEKIGYEWRLKQGWHWISVDKNSFYILGKQLGFLENVHQIQNLYFALTGKELTITH